MNRVVFKVGTSTLCHTGGGMNLRAIETLVRALTDIKNSGIEVVLVSSGAIGAGTGKLHLTARPASLREKQAVAAVGQLELMHIYDKLFGEYGATVGQILLTRNDTDDNQSAANLVGTFEALFRFGVIPVVNENDSVAFEEIESSRSVFGDNDMLSAVVARLIKADRLVLLTDTGGLYRSDPRTNPNADIIPIVYQIDDEIRSLAGGAGSSFGTGGMATKIMAAEYAFEAGIETVITNGSKPECVYSAIDNNPIGTIFRGV